MEPGRWPSQELGARARLRQGQARGPSQGQARTLSQGRAQARGARRVPGPGRAAGYAVWSTRSTAGGAGSSSDPSASCEFSA